MLTENDRSIISGAYMKIELSSVAGPNVLNSAAPGALSGEFGPQPSIVQAGGGIVRFQFPPKVKSDGKAAKWMVSETASYEEIKTWNGASSRKFTLEWEYIVSDEFTIPVIAGTLRIVKGYFYTSVGAGLYPTIELQLYEIVPIVGRHATFRALDVSITHSDTLIRDGADTFPLHTQVSMPLELVTQIGLDGEGLLDVERLPKKPEFEWF